MQSRTAATAGAATLRSHGSTHLLRSCLLSACLLVLFALQVPTVDATSYTWTGDAADGLWATPANWNPAGVPTNADDQANITVASGVITLPSSIAIHRLNITVSFDTLQLLSVDATNLVLDEIYITYAATGDDGGGTLALSRVNLTVASVFQAVSVLDLSTPSGLTLTDSAIISLGSAVFKRDLTFTGSTSSNVTFVGPVLITNAVILATPAFFANSSITTLSTYLSQLRVKTQKVTFDTTSQFLLTAGIISDQPALLLSSGILQLNSGFQLLDLALPMTANGGELILVGDTQIASFVASGTGAPDIVGLATSWINQTTGLTTSSYPTLRVQSFRSDFSRFNTGGGTQIIESLILIVSSNFSIILPAVAAGTLTHDLMLSKVQLQLLEGSTTTVTQAVPGLTRPIRFLGVGSTTAVSFAGTTMINGTSALLLYQLNAFFTNASVTTFASSLTQLTMLGGAVTFDTLASFELAPGVAETQSPRIVANALSGGGTLRLNSGFQLASDITLGMHSLLLPGSNVELVSVLISPATASSITGGSLAIDHLAVDASAALSGALTLTLNAVEAVIRSSFNITSVNGVSPGSMTVSLLSGTHLTLPNTSSVDVRSTGTGKSPNVTISADSTSRLSLLSLLTYSAAVGRLQLLGSQLDFLPPTSDQLRQVGTGPIVLTSPNITSSSPRRGHSGTALTVTITGTGFVHPGSLAVLYGASKSACTNLTVLDGTTLTCSIGTDLGDEILSFALVYTDTYNTPSSSITVADGGSFTSSSLTTSGCTVLAVPNGLPGTCATNQADGETCSVTCLQYYSVAGSTTLQCVGAEFTGTQYCTLDPPSSSDDLLGSLSKTSSDIVIAFICLFAFLCILLLVWLCRRRQQQKGEPAKKDVADPSSTAVAVAAAPEAAPSARETNEVEGGGSHIVTVQTGAVQPIPPPDVSSPAENDLATNVEAPRVAESEIELAAPKEYVPVRVHFGGDEPAVSSSADVAVEGQTAQPAGAIATISPSA